MAGDLRVVAATITSTAVSGATQAVPTPGSRFLSRVPPETYQRLVAQSTRVPLTKEEHLSEAGTPSAWSFLPCSGLVSLQTMTAEGESVEVAMVGNDGIVRLPGPTPVSPAAHTAVVVIPGEALRVRTDLLRKELERDPPSSARSPTIRMR